MADEIVFHPATGELLEHLERIPPETLADALDAIQRRQRQLKDASAAIDAELRRRLRTVGHRVHTWGGWEVRVEKPRRRAEWDANALEETLTDLVGQGVLEARDCAGVIRREVSRSRADQIVKRLTGPAEAKIESCREWVDDGRPKLTVTRSALVEAPAPAVLPHPADGGQPAEKSDEEVPW